MTAKIVTKNDMKIFASIVLLALATWYWIDQNSKAHDPFYSCTLVSGNGQLELKLNDDRTEVDLVLDDNRNYTVPIDHMLHEGSNDCGKATYLFVFQEEQFALSNIGCVPQEDYIEGSIGYVYRGQWKGGDDAEFEWTGNWVEPPAIIENCF